jgi:peptidoglycan/xylan/chitin deacetylase (PgdA/CDA1 family)
MYHGFGRRDPRQDPNDLFLPAETLARQLRILRRWFRPLDLDEFLRAYDTGRWPRRSVLVTIDDGYVSTLEVAAPLLSRHGVPAVVFVCPGRLGSTSAWIPELPTERLMDARQLGELAAARLDVGAHGMDHTSLTRLPADELSAHTAGAREALAAVLSRPPRAFAYPYGDVDHAAIDAVRQAGYDIAFAVGEHPARTSGDQRFALPRVNVNSYDSSLVFALKASGHWHSALRLTRRAPRVLGAAARLAGRRPYDAGVGSSSRVSKPPRNTRVQVLRGDVLRSLGTELDELLESVSAPVTWRRPWLQAWVDCYPHFEPWAVVASQDSKTVGAALLASRRHKGGTQVVAIGHGPSDQIRMPLRDPAAADVMAAAILGHVRTLPGPRRLIIDQLPDGDPVAQALAALRGCTLRGGDASPTVRFGADRSARAYTSRNHHQLVRRLTNRLHATVCRPCTPW